METFVTEIYVKELRGGVRNFEIPLSENNRQHLIITGKNGSGKTSLLEEIKKFLAQIENGNIEEYENYQNLLEVYSDIDGDFDDDFAPDLADYAKWVEFVDRFGGTEIFFSDENVFRKLYNGNFVLAYFGAKRTDKMIVPKNVEKIKLQKIYGLDEKANSDFIKYIVSLKADRSFARDEGDEEEAKKIDEWFELFENQLKIIFDDDDLQLLFERNPNEYNFNIETDGNKFGINELSDGYAAILNIVSELLLRMKAHNAKAYDMEGIVLIDEIETHLHVELQKRILPFLTAFFPKIQFIVTTHSPFVLSSIQNATICDLETRIVTTDLSAYSYDALVENYFMADKYSEIVKQKIAEYEKLLSKKEKTVEDTENIKSLQEYFAGAKFISKELRVKLQQIELKELS